MMINPPESDTTFSVKQQATIERLSNAAESDVKEIAVTQLELLSQYYELSLSQAGRSFRVALIASGVGLVFFLGIITYLLIGTVSTEVTTAGIFGGALSSFISGVNFFLYGKTLNQLNIFQSKLESTQRFLLANSLCENLENNLKQKTRARLIGKLVGVDDTDYLREHNDNHDNAHTLPPHDQELNFNPANGYEPQPGESIHLNENDTVPR